MAVSLSSASAIHTKKVIDVFKELAPAKTFLREFFPSVETDTKDISIEVQRGTEKVAVDVSRNSIGNRNQLTKSTERIYEPPYFREYLDITQLRSYDRLFGSENPSVSAVSSLATETAEGLMALRNLIERAYELQCAQVLTSGIVQVKNGDNIDYKRKALSLVDLGAGNYFANATTNPYGVFETGANFLRQEGKASGGVINALCGSKALSDLLTNEVFLKRNDLKNLPLDAVAPALRQSNGSTLHGEITAGSYRIRLWSYPEFYTNAAGDSTPYLDPKKIILLPESPRFKFGFAAVPQLIESGVGVLKGAYLIGSYVDDRKFAHEFDIRSAGIAIPTAVDQIYTVKVVA